MTHLTNDVLARYLIQTSPTPEREMVDWHLEYCPICSEEISIRELVLTARDARERLVAAVRAAERN